MKVSREGLALIRSLEGFRPRAQRREDERWVIGYGHTLSAREGARVSLADADLLLQYDLLPVVKAIGAASPTPLNQHQFDALASFVMNIGVDAFEGSEVRTALAEGHPARAARAMAAWREGTAADPVARRRAAERALFVLDPAQPATLADLLAAPVVEPEVVSEPEAPVEAVAPAAVAEPVESTSEPQAEPQPEAQADARAAAVAALLGERAEDEAAPSAVVIPFTRAEPAAPPVVQEPEPEPVAEAPAEEVEPQPEPESAPEPEPVEEAVEAAEPEAVEPAVEEAQPEPEPEPSEPEAEVVVEESIAEVVAPEPQPEPEVSSESEAVPANDGPPAEPLAALTFQRYSPYQLSGLGPLPEIKPSNAPEPVATTPTIETPTITPASISVLSTEPPKPIHIVQLAPPEPEALSPEAEAALAAQAPILVADPAVASPEPLVLTPAPEVSTQTAREVWPDSARDELVTAPADPLFEEEALDNRAFGSLVRNEVFDPAAPRFGWGDTGAFVAMGGVGLVAFGAAMAGFRMAAQESDGGSDTMMIAGVLALIGAICVGVSAYNLYRRLGGMEPRDDQGDEDA